VGPGWSDIYSLYLEPLAKLSSGFGLCQGTTSVVPQMAHSDFPALAAAELQTTEGK
jgi:hypothetical protein